MVFPPSYDGGLFPDLPCTAVCNVVRGKEGECVTNKFSLLLYNFGGNPPLSSRRIESSLEKKLGGRFFSLFLPLDAFVEPLPKIFFEGRIFIAVEREGKTFLRSPIERFPPKYRADKRFFFFLKDI